LLALSMAGRKRKATTSTSKSSDPAKRVARKSAAMEDEQQAAANAANAAVPPSRHFSDLPFQFVVQMVGEMTFTEMSSFRLSCTQGLEAVDHWGRAQRSFDIKRLISELWPEKKEALNDFHFDSLETVKKELSRLAQWIHFDLITSIDFDGVHTMNRAQLEAVFGVAPRANVRKINLADSIVTSEVWATLASLFPGVRSIRCSEDTAGFPPEIMREIALAGDKKMAAHTLLEQRRLVETGMLDEERVATLR
ncbi:hypothetical protein PMAYCL1PPCAC_13423, partial [Pristionchus mayeri]